MIRRQMYTANRVRLFVLNISATVAKPHMRNLAIAAGWDARSPVLVNITAPYINQIVLEAAQTFPGGLTLAISASTTVAGKRMATAIYTRIPVTIDNLGKIAGGGSWGGSGGAAEATFGGTRQYVYGGQGGMGAGFNSDTDLVISPAQAGSSGGYSSDFPSFGGGAPAWVQGGEGGSGGPLGGVGGWGTRGSYGGPSGTTGILYSEYGPGAPGNYIDGNSYVTWKNTGTRLGGVA